MDDILRRCSPGASEAVEELDRFDDKGRITLIFRVSYTKRDGRTGTKLRLAKVDMVRLGKDGLPRLNFFDLLPHEAKALLEMLAQVEEAQ